MDAKGSGFIGSCRNHATRGRASHDDGAASIFGMFQLFHGGKEGIHVYVHNPAFHKSPSYIE
jgi:hypothetical protein